MSLITMVVLLTGCTSNWVMRADFDNYIPGTSNQQLEGDILGKPDGDRIDNVCMGGDVKVLQGIPYNLLRIDDCFATGVEFITSSHDSPAEYLIDWDGKREFPENSLLTFIAFRGEGQGLTLRFQLSKLDILVNGTPAVDPIDVQSLSSHAITLEIKTGGNSTVDVFYQEKSQDGAHGPRITRSISLNNFTKLTSITVSAQEFGGYVIGDLDVYAKN